MSFKYFNVKNGLVTGNIVLHSANAHVQANYFLGNISVTNSANLGNVSNVKITGGTGGYVLQTDGTGNLSWASQGSESPRPNISNGNSNVNIPSANGNITFTAVGNANVVVITGTGANIAGTLKVAGQSNLGPVGNVVITGGTNGYVLQTDGSGTLSWVAQSGGSSSISNGNSNVSIPTANGNINFTAVSNTTMVITDTGANISGTANITGNLIADNANLGNLVTANFFTGNGSELSALTFGNITTFTTANLTTDELYLQGTTRLNVTASGSSGYLFDQYGATLNPAIYVTSGQTLAFNLDVSGHPFLIQTSGSANYSVGLEYVDTAGTVSTSAAAQGQVSGTLYWKVPYGITGNYKYQCLYHGGMNGNIVVTDANIANIQVGNAVVAGTVYTNAQPNITSVGTLTSLSVTGNTTSGNFIGILANGNSNVNIPTANGNINLSAVGNTTLVITGTGANISGTANVTGNIVGGGELNVSGNGVIGGNLTVNGTLTYINSTTLSISDPIINLQTGPNGVAPIANSGKDVGTALNYYDTSAKIAWMGWDVSNAEISFGSNVSIASEVVTYNSLANIRSGNAQLGNAVTANYFIGSGNNLSNIQGANVSGQVANALVAGTVYTNAQPNITLVGSLTGLTVSNATGVVNFTTTANVTLGSVANLHISGGTSAYVLSTDGAGTLSWVAQAGSSSASNISNGNSNVNIPTANGNVNITSGGNTSLVVTDSGANITGNIEATANITAQYFTGNGYYLTGVATNPANISNGTSNVEVSLNGNVSTSVSGNANILVVTGTGINVTGNATIGTGTGGNLSGANVVTANLIDAVTVNVSANVNAVYYTGNGYYLTGVSTNPANISNGTSNVEVSLNGNVSTSVSGNANILVVTGTGINVTGNATIGTGTGGNLSGANNISANTFTGSLTTAAQGNISSVGSLTGLTVSNATGIVNFTTTANVTLGSVSNLHISGGTGGYVLSTDGSGTLSWVAQSGGGSSSISNGNSNVSIPSANGNVNISAVGNANVVVITGTGVNVAGTLNTGTGNGSFGNVNAGNLLTANFTTAVITTAAQPNITSVGSLTGLTVSNATGVVNFTTTANVTLGAVANLHISGGTSTYVLSTDGAGNLSWVAQSGGGSASISNGTSNVTIATSGGNVTTSVGGASNVLVVTATGANISGTLNATGNANVDNIGATGVFSTTLAGNLTTAAQPNITSVGTLTSLDITGNISSGNANLGNAVTANYFIGSGNNLSNIQGSNISGAVAYATTANSVAGANVTGQVGNALVAGTVYTNAQPNITSIGSLAGLTVSNATGVVDFTTTANVTLGSVSNLHISGGTGGYVLQTDGSGTLSWVAQSSSGLATISNGNSNVNIPAANGNVNISAVGNANILVVTGTGANVAGTLQVSGQSNLGAVGNVVITGGTSSQYLQTDGAGNLSWSSISSSSTLGNGNSSVTIPVANGNINLSAVGNANILVVTGTGANVAGTLQVSGQSNLGAVGNVVITGGTTSQYLQTDGAGNLSWASISSSSTLANGNSNVNIPAANGNVNISAVGNANILVVTGTGANITGTANITGNVVGANFVGKLANGNSNITITSNANITLFVAGNATARANFTTTGANITGTANISGLVTGANFITNGANGTVQSNNITITGAASGIANVLATMGNMGLRTVASTYTDTSAAATIANGAIHYIATPTIVGSNAMTYTNLATFYIASNPTASTNATVTTSYAMFVASGDTYLGGNLNTGGGTGGNISGANVISATTITAAGNATVGNLIAGSGSGGNITGANVITANTFIGVFANGNSNVNIPAANGNINFSAVGNANVVVITGTGVNVAGTLNTGTGNILGGNIIGIIAAGANAITTTGNISGGNLIGVFANGNSNVSIPAANGNVNISATGAANVLVVTSTGSNITGTLNVSGNATVGNLISSGGNISSANVISANTFLASNTITSPQLISNIAIGTAPLVVTSTTRVSNLNVAYANVTDFINVTTATTGTYYPIFANAVTGNVEELANTNLSYNAATSTLSATLFTGTLTTAAQPNITSTGSLTGLTVSNATGVVNFTTTANVTLGNVSNLHISGGTSAYVLSTDGAGTLSWVAQSGGGGSPGGTNTQVQFNDGSAFGGNAGLTFNKTTTTLTANNFVATSTANLGSNANVIITGGTNGYVLSTNGSGGLSWIASGGGGGASISNGTSNVNIAASAGNITMGVGGVANVVVVSTAGISAALKPRVVVIADASSVTINGDTTDMATQVNTGTGTLTVNAPTGTPYDGQKLLFRIQSTNSLTFVFNAIFIGSTDLAPPTVTSGSSKYDYMGWMYNSGATKWNLISRNFGFV